jgi:hypothetical protein
LKVIVNIGSYWEDLDIFGKKSRESQKLGFCYNTTLLILCLFCCLDGNTMVLHERKQPTVVHLMEELNH